VAALARGGRRLALDGQGLVRLARTGPLSTDASVDRSMLAALAVLTLNEEEAETLVGAAEPERLHTLGVREVVLTLGSRGAVVVADAEATHIAPQPVDGAVDPTGAGDAFSLLYVEGRANGATPVEAGARAARIVAELISRP
jgi:sugar/nucleoside kinase (ribokinase family)